jgi:hypothetical protein
MNEEKKATEALLDIGLSVPLRPVRFRKWKWIPRVTIYRPPLGGMLRILQIWFSLNTTVEQLDKMNATERLRFKMGHGRDVSKMVALCICSGFLNGKLFVPMLAWFLHWRCHEETMLYVVTEYMRLQDTKSFTTIIKLVAATNVAAPRVSQRKRS